MQHENSKHRQADKAGEDVLATMQPERTSPGKQYLTCILNTTDANRRAKAFRQHVQSAVSARAKGAQSPQYEKYVGLEGVYARILVSNTSTMARLLASGPHAGCMGLYMPAAYSLLLLRRFADSNSRSSSFNVLVADIPATLHFLQTCQ